MMTRRMVLAWVPLLYGGCAGVMGSRSLYDADEAGLAELVRPMDVPMVAAVIGKHARREGRQLPVKFILHLPTEMTKAIGGRKECKGVTLVARESVRREERNAEDRHLWITSLERSQTGTRSLVSVLEQHGATRENWDYECERVGGRVGKGQGGERWRVIRQTFLPLC